MTKGMLVDIYRHAGPDTSNHGVSQKMETMLLVGPGIPKVFPVADRPVLQLIKKNGTGKPHLIAVPDTAPEAGNIGWMFGGNFAFSPDSRFPGKAPIPIHDRQESAEVHDHMEAL